MTVYERNTTDLSVGDEFTFRGLHGQDVAKCTITILFLGPTGVLRVQIYNHETDGKELLNVQYTDAVAMVEERIWYDGRAVGL